MAVDPQGRTAVVTGAARGLGAPITRRPAGAGCAGTVRYALSVPPSSVVGELVIVARNESSWP